MSIPFNTSGVVIDQNAPQASPSDFIALSSSYVYQEFLLPPNWLRGPLNLAPDLTGFGVFVNVDTTHSADCSYSWTFDTATAVANVWTTVASGTVTGTNSDGSVWSTMFFPKPLSTQQLDPTTQVFRLGLKAGAHVSSWCFTTPNPLGDRGSASFGPLFPGPTLYPSPFLYPSDGGQSFSFMFRIFGATADAGIDFLGNTYRSVARTLTAANITPSAEQDTFWLSAPRPSQFAVESLVFPVTDDGTAAVVDSVTIDPLTLGLTCHVYYTSQGDPGVSYEDWNDRVWHPVVRDYVLNGKQSLAFPEPVIAKYFKLEFSHLQPMPFAPPTLAPVTYQKFPSWVQTFFMQQLTAPNFAATSTSVTFDRWNLAYVPYTDDLLPGPDFPASTDPVSGASTASSVGLVDPVTARNIDPRFQPLQTAPYNLVARDSSILVDRASPAGVSPPAYPAEYQTNVVTNPGPVSTTERDQTVAQLSMPSMYFFLPVRHHYRTVRASFVNGQAYFAGIKSVLFQRDAYATASDSGLYIEGGGDTFNTFTSDFQLSPTQSMTTYDTTAVGPNAGQMPNSSLPPPIVAQTYGITPTRWVLP